MRRRAHREGVRSDLRFLGRASSEMHVDQQRQHRRGSGARRVHLGQSALEDVARQPGLAAREVNRREGTGCIDVRVRMHSVEQLLRLFEATLADAQVGKPDERALAKARTAAEPPQAYCFCEGRVGFWPPTRSGEHTSVVRAAERGDERQVSPLCDGFAHADPLVGPRDVVRVLTRGEQLAEDLLDDEEVFDFPAGDGRERLVEQQHPLLDAVAVHEARAEVGEGRELEVGVAVPAGFGQRVAEQCFLAHAIAFEHPDVEGDPA